MLTLKNPKTLAWSFCVKWRQAREGHVRVEDVCFVLFSRVVLFTLERKFSLVVYVCVCVSCGLSSAYLGILLPLSHCKLLCLQSSEQVEYNCHGVRAQQLEPPPSPWHGILPKGDRKEVELKSPHAETLGAL